MTLVLLGALGTTRAMWEPLREGLGAADVRAFDLPGHGGSPLPDGPVRVETIARRLLDELPEHFSFCGLSLGGMVGLWLGANASARVDHLVLACTGAKLGERDDYLARAELVRREGTGVTADGARERWFTAPFRDTPQAERTLADLRAVPAEAYAACCEAVGEFDFRGDLQRIAAPALAIFGADDPVTPPEVRDTLLHGIPDVRGLTIRRAAHLASVEQPAAFARAVLDHVRGSE